MKRTMVFLTAALMGAAVMAEGPAATSPAAPAVATHNEAMCQTHCNLMDLRKKVDALKAQQNGPDKMATKEHLKKDIARYEQELRDLKAKLESM